MIMRLVALAAASAAAAVLLAGCTNTDVPTAYGRDGACWYVDDPAEVTALQAAGYCPTTWRPAPMPSTWRDRYADYYDSPDYYQRFVPKSRQKVYVEHVHVYVVQRSAASARATQAAATRAAQVKATPRPTVARSFNGKPAPVARPTVGKASGSTFRAGSRR